MHGQPNLKILVRTYCVINKARSTLLASLPLVVNCPRKEIQYSTDTHKQLTNIFPLLHTNKARLPSLHPPHFPLIYLERKLLLPEGRTDIAWKFEVLHNFLFACCKFSVVVTWSSNNWLTSHSQANPRPHLSSLCLNFIHRTAAIWLCNAVLYVNAHLVFQPQLVSQWEMSEHLLQARKSGCVIKSINQTISETHGRII
jgi:hypothetical protein